MGCLSKGNFLSVLCCLCLNLGVVAVDTIRSSQFIKDKDSDYMISNGSVFKLGFFSPVNSTNRYLGIWYNNISAFTVVWVANRQKPLNDSSGVLTISKDGNLVVLNGQKEILWSSNVNKSITNSSAQLLDLGNLVLKENTTGTILWESFNNPSHILLPEMKLSTNERTGEKVKMTSWKSPFDPSIGSFSGGIYRRSLTQAFIWKDGQPYFRSGPWDGQKFIGSQKYPPFHDMVSLVQNQDGTTYLISSFLFHSSHFVLTTQGNTEGRYWDNEKEDWKAVWKAINSVCDVYGTCGAFGSCNSMSSPICSCLEGFKPKNTEEWNRQNWTSGCVRRTPLQCGRLNTSGESGKMDVFLKLTMMKVPDFEEWSAAQEDDCRQQCLQNCSCIAYAFDSGTGCMTWTRSLIDIQKISYGTEVDLHICVAHLELDSHKENLLDWRKRFNIIEGIGRGLLYLHRDSRLRIIHRDLKASNILLDKDLNPKISDFGMARIFGSNEDQGTTNRVVGTYGYMSPEYAMEGQFSEKSDIFSFGVLLLKILSGRRNSRFYYDEQFVSLLGHAWKLWKEDNIGALIDPMISETCYEMEILRCIHVGLLCVQEFAEDRPTVSTVISMLKSEIVDLPYPKQPAFTKRQIGLDTKSSKLSQKKCSVNNVTITMIQGR